MSQAALAETKNELSAFVNAVASGAEPEHIILRHSKPVAKIVPIETPVDTSKRIGLFKDDPRFHIDDEAFDAMDAEIAEMFGV